MKRLGLVSALLNALLVGGIAFAQVPPNASGTLMVPNGGGGGSSAITAGTTATSGCTDNSVLASRSNLVACDGAMLMPSGGPVSIGNGGNNTTQLTFTPNSGTTTSFGSANSGSNLLFFQGATANLSFGSHLQLGNASRLTWSNSASPAGTQDVGLSRLAIGILQVGNGAANALGTLVSSAYRVAGTVPTGNTGTCNTGVTVAGGATAGTWTSSAACALAGTIILTAMPTQTTGYVCFMTDRTTPGVVIEETATTATTATFTVRSLPTGTVQAAANDILQYSCTGY